MTTKIQHCATVKINLNEMSEKQQEALWRAEQELSDAGVFFDTGFDLKDNYREWFFDEGEKKFIEVSFSSFEI